MALCECKPSFADGGCPGVTRAQHASGCFVDGAPRKQTRLPVALLLKALHLAYCMATAKATENSASDMQDKGKEAVT